MRFLVLLAALAAVPLTARAQQPTSAAVSPLDTVALAAALRAELEATRAPGAAMAVVVGDRIAWATAIGVESSETRVPMTVESLVRIGSVTKVVTAATASLLAEQGTLDLDAPIARHASGLAPAIGARTLRALLTHGAGMINEAAGDGSHDDAALGRRVRGWKATHLFAPAGDVYAYSSPGYWLAGHVLEQAGKQPYADLVEARLLRPLGMRRSTVRPLAAMTWPHAQDHRVRGDSVMVIRPYPDDASTWPSGSLFSNVLELSRFAIALVNDGRVDGREVLPAAAVRRLLVADARAPQLPGSPCMPALALTVCRRGSVTIAGHYGYRAGSGAVFTLAPGERVAVIILVNRNGGIFGRTEQAALEMLLGARLQSTETRPRTLGPMNWARWSGRWASGPDTLHVYERADRLWYRYGAVEQRAAISSHGELAVLDDDGTPVQSFRMVRGARTGEDYMHDGLNAFRRVAGALGKSN